MMKQTEYSQIYVKCFDTEQSIDEIDSSIADASIADTSL